MYIYVVCIYIYTHISTCYCVKIYLKGALLSYVTHVFTIGSHNWLIKRLIDSIFRR